MDRTFGLVWELWELCVKNGVWLRIFDRIRAGASGFAGNPLPVPIFSLGNPVEIVVENLCTCEQYSSNLDRWLVQGIANKQDGLMLGSTGPTPEVSSPCGKLRCGQEICVPSLSKV